MPCCKALCLLNYPFLGRRGGKALYVQDRFAVNLKGAGTVELDGYLISRKDLGNVGMLNVVAAEYLGEDHKGP